MHFIALLALFISSPSLCWLSVQRVIRCCSPAQNERHSYRNKTFTANMYQCFEMKRNENLYVSAYYIFQVATLCILLCWRMNEGRLTTVENTAL